MRTTPAQRLRTMSDHPTFETVNRWPKDQHLRRHGFKIHSRESGKPPLWERDGIVYTQAEAEKLAHGELKLLEKK